MEKVVRKARPAAQTVMAFVSVLKETALTVPNLKVSVPALKEIVLTVLNLKVSAPVLREIALTLPNLKASVPVLKEIVQKVSVVPVVLKAAPLSVAADSCWVKCSNGWTKTVMVP